MNKYLSSLKPWPLGLAILGTVFVAVNLALVTWSFRHTPQLTSEKYYSEGLNLKEIEQRKAATAATGWKVQVRSLPFRQADMPLVELTVTDPLGRVCDSLSGEVGFYRPSEKALDLSPIPIRFAGQGRYLVFPPQKLLHGAWQAVVHLNRGSQEYLNRLSFMVEK